LKGRQNHMYSWTDNLQDSQHHHQSNRANPLNDNYTGFEGQVWCKYRAVAGLQYGLVRKENGEVEYRTKNIIHLVVDESLGEDKAYRYCCDVISDLSERWIAGQPKGKLTCQVNRKDEKWLSLLQVAGFHISGEDTYYGESMACLEMECGE